jgi:GT2 family glycosyltransferase
VVFATMNRREAALGCVRALAAQTVSPWLVVVADNGSTDGTVEALEGAGNLPFRLEVRRMAENLGNAGGVEAAMAVAMAAGAAAVWVLDDDSWPQPAALEALLARGLRDDVVCHPFQVDPKTGKLSWPVPLRASAGAEWQLVWSMEELPCGDAWESRPSWTGALIPRGIVERAGPVNGKLFIRGEDDEYSFRIARMGVRYEVVRVAVLDHPGPVGLVYGRIMGRAFFWEPGLAWWKLYYKVRNMVWLKRTSGGAGMAMAAVMACGWGVLRHDPWEWGRWRVFARAVRDGWLGRLGRIKAPWAP